MNFLLQQRALCVAENASHTLHNVLTLRGAPVRDAHVWARYLDETIDVFGDSYDVAFASHHWPIWGRSNVVRFLGEQRDLYAYLHDQTLRMLNRGLTGTEIAEELLLPPALERASTGRAGRLLRLGQPQRQGRLPAVHGLVPTTATPPPLGASAGRTRATVRGVGGRPDGDPGQGPGVRRRR